MRDSEPTELSDLRRRVAAGEYQIDAPRIAASMVRRLIEVGRLRRILDDLEGGRTRPASGPPR